MKPLIILVAFLGLVGFESTAQADYYDGLKAYKAKEYQTAYDIWLPLAREGNAGAQYGVGEIFMESALRAPLVERLIIRSHKGLSEKDLDRAAETWLKRSAEQAHVDAQYALARMYQRGSLGYSEYRKAVLWYRRAADQGLTGAMIYLAGMIGDRRYVDYDIVEAAKWGLLFVRRRYGHDFKRVYPNITLPYFDQLTEEQKGEVERWVEAWEPDFP